MKNQLPLGARGVTRTPPTAMRIGRRVQHPEDGSLLSLPISEVLSRIGTHRLARVDLRPVATHYEDGRVAELEFDTELSLTVAEAVALQLRRVIRLDGYQLVSPKRGRPYFRDSPDREVDDNLEQLPRF